MKLPGIVRQIAGSLIKSTPILRRHILFSTDYLVLSGVDEARKVAASSGGWLAARTVARQERAYEGLIAAMKRGEPRLDFKVAAEAIAATGIANPRLLTLLPGDFSYTGIDYSDAMIARAHAHYPSGNFRVADATELPYADGAFDIVFNGVSLMHIIDYQAAIREAARVALRYCVFHSVTVLDDHRTTYLRKFAYGAPVVEVVFGKLELMTLCRQAGLRLEREWTSIPYDVSSVTGHHSSTETYLFAL